MKTVIGIWPSYVVVVRSDKIRIYFEPTKASLCRLAWLEILGHNKEKSGNLRIFEWKGARI